MSVPVSGCRREEADKAAGGTRAGIGQVAVTAVFTFTCFTVPVMTAGAGDRAATESATAPGLAQAAAPVWSDARVALQVKDLKAQFRAEQEALVARYQEQWKLAQDASREERERIRGAFKEEQAELLARQKELREEWKAQWSQFKREHPAHLEVIEAARETAKARGGARRGTSAG